MRELLRDIPPTAPSRLVDRRGGPLRSGGGCHWSFSLGHLWLSHGPRLPDCPPHATHTPSECQPPPRPLTIARERQHIGGWGLRHTQGPRDRHRPGNKERCRGQWCPDGAINGEIPGNTAKTSQCETRGRGGAQKMERYADTERDAEGGGRAA